MRKIFVFMLVFIMTASMCVNAGALYALDCIQINNNELDPHNFQAATSLSYRINEGEKMYISGWALSSPGKSSLDKVFYTVDGGDPVYCEGLYRDRGQVGSDEYYTWNQVYINGKGYETWQLKGAGFGSDDQMLELTGIDELKAGVYHIEINALYVDGSVETFSGTGYGDNRGVFTLTVTGDPDESDTDTDTDTDSDADRNTLENVSVYYAIDSVQINSNVIDFSLPRDLSINYGDKVYTIGWALDNSGSESPLEKIVYTVNGGNNIECSNVYRSRPDLLDCKNGVYGSLKESEFKNFSDEQFEKAGFGSDDNMIELTGIGLLGNGTYDVAVKAVFENGTEGILGNEGAYRGIFGPGTFKLTITGAPDESDTDTDTDPDSILDSVDGIYCIDRITVNVSNMYNSYGCVNSTHITINHGDKMYINGWAVSEPGEAGLDKIVYTVDGGDPVKCYGIYRDTPDVKGAIRNSDKYGSWQFVGAGFGNKTNMLELTSIGNLAPGEYQIKIYALYKDGRAQLFDDHDYNYYYGDKVHYYNGVFTLTVLCTGSHENMIGAYFNDETGHWRVCPECGESVGFEEHTYGDEVITEKPTCIKEGTAEKTCTVCGYVHKKTIDVGGHKPGNWRSNGTEHWCNCSVCGEKIIEDHIYGEETVISEPNCTEKGEAEHTCTICGYTESYELDELGHTLAGIQYNLNSHWRKCTRCNAKVEVNEHNYGEEMVISNPTCTEKGEAEHTCTVCGYTETYDLDALGHNCGKYKYDKDNHWHICTVCGEKTDTEDHIFENGEICVVCGYSKTTKTGDMNNDGKVNNKDVVTLFRLVAQGVTEYNKVYDFNNDNKINNKDVVALFRSIN